MRSLVTCLFASVFLAAPSPAQRTRDEPPAAMKFPLVIDHVSVAGPDLKAMQAALASVGIKSEYGGSHSNHATEMAQTSFPDGSYLELIAVQPNADKQAVDAHYWSKQLKDNAGPTAWAIRSKNIASDNRDLKSLGASTNAPTKAGRSRPDGAALEWESAPIGPEPNGVFFPFLIRDFSSRNKRAFPTGKATTQDFEGVSKVVIAVNNLKKSLDRYRDAFGLPTPAVQTDSSFGAQLVAFSGTPVILASPLDDKSWLAQRIAKFGEGPCAFILTGNRTAAYATGGGQSRWFAMDIRWLDTKKLGWYLGFEKEK